MTIVEKIYNFYNGLLGRGISEMIDDPRIDTFIENGIEKRYSVSEGIKSFTVPSRNLDILNKNSYPRIWDKDLQKYVRTTKIKGLFYQLEELKRLINSIRECSKKFELFTKETCPLEKIDEHYRFSRILMEEESYEWNCPFCNKKYST